jgi:hypothetical protein
MTKNNEFQMVIVFWVSEPGSAVFPKMCFSDIKESATGSQVIRGYISVMDILKITYFLNITNSFISKIAIFL